MYGEMTNRILDFLERGRRNAKSRVELAVHLGLSDRAMRSAVCMARLEGACICNEQDGGGYYLPETLAEYKMQYVQTERRGKRILAQLKALRHELSNIADKDQLCLFDEATEAFEDAAKKLEAVGEAIA